MTISKEGAADGRAATPERASTRRVSMMLFFVAAAVLLCLVSIFAWRPTTSVKGFADHYGLANMNSTYRASGVEVPVNTVMAAQCRLDEGPWRDAASVDGAFDGKAEVLGFITPVLSEGVHTVETRARDSVGKWQTSYRTYTFVVDLTDPEAIMDAIPEYVRSLTHITGTASDKPSGELDRVLIRITDETAGAYWDGGTWISTETWVTADGTSSWKYAVSFTLDGHSYNVAAKAIDKAGNESPVVRQSFTVDTSRPVALMDNIPDFLNSVVSLHGAACDVPPGRLDKVQVIFRNENEGVCWNGTSWVREDVWLDPEGLESWSLPMPPLTNGCLYSISIRAVDRAGNESEAFDSFILDNSGPAIALRDIRDYVNMLSDVTGTSEDVPPGQMHMVEVQIRDQGADLYWDGASWASTPSWIQAIGTTSWSVQLGPLLDGRTYEILARGFDRAGNVSETRREVFTCDAVRPTVSLAETGSFAPQITEVCVNAADTPPGEVWLVGIRITDGTEGLYWDGGKWVTDPVWIEAVGTSSWGCILPPQLDGHFYRIEAKCIDLAGNESDTALTVFSCDTSRPVLLSVGFLPEQVGGTYTIGGAASDGEQGELGVVRLLIYNRSDSTYWNGQSWVEGREWVDAAGTLTWSYTLPALTGGKIYEIEARCVDRAGNVSSAEILTFILGGQNRTLIWFLSAVLAVLGLIALGLMLSWLR